MNLFYHLYFQSNKFNKNYKQMDRYQTENHLQAPSLFSQFRFLSSKCTGIALLLSSFLIFLTLDSLGAQNIHWVLQELHYDP